MLNTLTVERYRAFVSPATLEVRPLTVLFGPNSHGKSSILRALPLLAASCGPAAPNRTGPLALEHPAAMGARYADLRTSLVARNDLGLKLAWGVDEIEIGLRDMTDLGPSRQVVSRLTIRDKASREVVRADLDVETGQLVTEGRKPGVIALEGIRPTASTGLPAQQRDAVTRCGEQMARLHGAVDWLGPVRVLPPRVRVQRIEHPRLGPFGEAVTEVLARTDGADLLRTVSAAARDLFGVEILVVQEAGEVSLAAGTQERRAHVLDVGAGVTQVLPALVRLAEIELGMARERIVAIEQPETHLHPDAEVALANVVLRAVAAQRTSAKRPRLVLETHSENLLLSLQLAILEHQIAPEDVLTCWFDRLDDGSLVLTPIAIDEEGRPSPSLPPGAFSDNLELARKIVRARSRRR